MTGDHGPFTHSLEAWLDAEDGFLDSDAVLERALEQVETKPQRRAGPWPDWRSTVMNKTAMYLAAAAAVVVIAAIGFGVIGVIGGFGGTGLGGPPPSTEASIPEPSATPQASVSEPTDTSASLPDGPYLMWDDPETGPSITITIAGPDWTGAREDGYVVWGPTGADGPAGAGMIGFTEGEYYVYGDPCAWSSTRPDVAATTVDAFLAALANQASREASAPEDVMVDGYAGKKITLQMADDVAGFDDCDESTFGLFGVPLATDEDPWRTSQGPGQIEEVWAVDVDGLLVVNIGVYYPDTPQDAIDEVRAMLATATFESP